MSQLSEQLKPHRERLASRTQERDVLRISGFLGKSGWKTKNSPAILEILKWAKKHAKTNLEEDAWNEKSFKLTLAGRNIDCSTFSVEGSKVWGIRTEDPDKEKPGRIWVNEITLIKKQNELTRIGLRLLITSGGMDDDFSPAVPGCIQQLIETVGIHSPTNEFFATSRDINDKNSYMEFEDHLFNPERQTPLIVISGHSKENNYAIEHQKLAKAVMGMAHVYSLSFGQAKHFSKKVGKTLSVFDGGLRVYMPGFDESANPGAHRLITRLSLEDPNKTEFVIREVRRSVAQDSIRRNRLGREILSYSSVNSAKLKIETSKLEDKSKSDALELSLQNQIISLEKDIFEIGEDREKSLDLAIQYEELVKNTEEEKVGLIARVQTLEEAIKKSGTKVPKSEYPKSWEKIVLWVQENLSGHLELAPSAKKGLKNPQYESIETVCKCLEWLISEYREARMQGGDAAKNNHRLGVGEGIFNSLCGGDEYEFIHKGQKYKADWHIKNGGSKRAPERCLRIYYAWDESSNRIIVSDLPAHRRTSMT